MVAHPTGVVEVCEGAVDETANGTEIHLRSTLVGGTASAKEVTAMERDFLIDEDVIRYEVRMAAVGQPLTHHLAAELHRVETPVDAS